MRKEIISESIPRTIGRYQLLRHLGTGGLAQTYLALDNTNGEIVALKELHLVKARERKQIELFEREAATLAKIQHLQIPRFIDSLVDRSDREMHLCLVQEFITGFSLQELVDLGCDFSDSEVIAIIQSCLEPLKYLHNHNPAIYHRDIKPSNIILRPNGDCVLIDFGAVRETIGPAEARGSSVVGTFGYMAPEQFRAQAYPGTDLYGLGATAFHLLTGIQPMMLGLDRLKLQIRPHLRGHDSLLTTILDLLLEPMIEDRYPNVEMLQSALSNWEKKSGLQTLMPTPYTTKGAHTKTAFDAYVSELKAVRRMASMRKISASVTNPFDSQHSFGPFGSLFGSEKVETPPPQEELLFSPRSQDVVQEAKSLTGFSSLVSREFASEVPPIKTSNLEKSLKRGKNFSSETGAITVDVQNSRTHALTRDVDSGSEELTSYDSLFDLDADRNFSGPASEDVRDITLSGIGLEPELANALISVENSLPSSGKQRKKLGVDKVHSKKIWSPSRRNVNSLQTREVGVVPMKDPSENPALRNDKKKRLSQISASLWPNQIFEDRIDTSETRRPVFGPITDSSTSQKISARGSTFVTSLDQLEQRNSIFSENDSEQEADYNETSDWASVPLAHDEETTDNERENVFENQVDGTLLDTPAGIFDDLMRTDVAKSHLDFYDSPTPRVLPDVLSDVDKSDVTSSADDFLFGEFEELEQSTPWVHTGSLVTSLLEESTNFEDPKNQNENLNSLRLSRSTVPTSQSNQSKLKTKKDPEDTLPTSEKSLHTSIWRMNHPDRLISNSADFLETPNEATDSNPKSMYQSAEVDALQLQDEIASLLRSANQTHKKHEFSQENIETTEQKSIDENEILRGVTSSLESLVTNSGVDVKNQESSEAALKKLNESLRSFSWDLPEDFDVQAWDTLNDLSEVIPEKEAIEAVFTVPNFKSKENPSDFQETVENKRPTLGMLQADPADLSALISGPRSEKEIPAVDAVSEAIKPPLQTSKREIKDQIPAVDSVSEPVKKPIRTSNMFSQAAISNGYEHSKKHRSYVVPVEEGLSAGITGLLPGGHGAREFGIVFIIVGVILFLIALYMLQYNIRIVQFFGLGLGGYGLLLWIVPRSRENKKHLVKTGIWVRTAVLRRVIRHSAPMTISEWVAEYAYSYDDLDFEGQTRLKSKQIAMRLQKGRARIRVYINPHNYSESMLLVERSYGDLKKKE